MEHRGNHCWPKGLNSLALGIWTCWILSWPITLLAEPEPVGNEWVLKEIIPKGSAQSQHITCLAQTADGLIWFGTVDGLFAHDGYNTFRYDHANQPLLRNDRIGALAVDPDGSLWIGTLEDVEVYARGTFSVPAMEGVSPPRDVISIALTSDGVRWFGTYQGGLFRLGVGALLQPIKPASGSGPGRILSLAPFPDGQGLWVGTAFNGLFEMRDDRLQPSSRVAGDTSVSAILSTDQGITWIGTDDGLFTVESGTDEATLMREGQVTALAQDSEGTLWVGTRNGLASLQSPTDPAVEWKRMWPDLSIKCLLVDREGTLWVGTEGGSLRSLRRGWFSSFLASPENAKNVLCLSESHQGVVFAGTSFGLYSLESGQERKIESQRAQGEFITPTWIRSMLWAGDGTLWLGADALGLIHVSSDMRRILNHPPDLRECTIKSLNADHEGRIWAGTDRGLYRVEEEVSTPATFNGQPVKTSFFFACQTAEQEYWFGTYQGIMRGSRHGSTDFQVEHLPLDFPAMGMHMDGLGVAWVATYGGGLVRIQHDEIHTFATPQGLPTTHVSGIVEDGLGYFWLPADVGVCRIARDDLEACRRDQRSRITPILFGEPDGLPTHECSLFSNQSVMKDRHGSLWFATNKGASRIVPAQFDETRIPPPIARITEVRSQSGDVVPNHGGPVSVQGTGFSVQVAAASSLDPRATRFRCRLREIEGSEQIAGPSYQNNFRFREIPEGLWTVEVQASSRFNLWTQAPVILQVRLTPSRALDELVVWGLGGFALFAVMGWLFMRARRRPAEPVSNPDKYQKTRLPDAHAQRYVTRLQHALFEEEVYRNEQLSLQSLADQLHIPTHHLSQIINDRLNTTFFDLINAHRVEEATRVLRDTAKAPRIIDIIHDVGFNSKASFYRAFKKRFGMTPTEYRKQQI